MSWFRSSPPPAKQEPSQKEDGSYKPLKREERARCWEARDSYFACLDKNDILDAIKDKDAAESRCGKQNERFETDCASSWVQYFKQKRVAEFEKEERIKKLEMEGAVPPDKTKPSWKIW